MIQYAPTSLESARWLLDIKAVNFRPKNPYTLTAGWVSPVYIDCRWIISFPEARRRIIKLAVELLRREGNLDVTDLVAGGETAGIPYAAWIAEATNKPMLYVRKKPKGFGRNAQIEGALREGQRVILIEDLATDGGSKINFVRALRDAGAEISDIFVVFFLWSISQCFKCYRRNWSKSSLSMQLARRSQSSRRGSIFFKKFHKGGTRIFNGPNWLVKGARWTRLVNPYVKLLC